MRKMHCDLNLTPFPSVIERMTLLLKENDPLQEETYVDHALETIYSEVGMEEGDQFYFCYSEEEALYSILLSATRQKKHLILAIEEKPFFKELLLELKRMGLKVSLLSPDNVSVDLLEKWICDETALVVMSGVHAMTGKIYPIDQIAHFCARKNVSCCVDASLMLGVLPFCLQEHPIDYVFFDGKALLGPKETAGIFVKKRAFFHPLFSHQKKPPAILLEALSKAFLENARHFDHYHLEIARLRALLEEKLAKLSEVSVLFKEAEKLPNYTTIAVSHVTGEMMSYFLARKGVYTLLFQGAVAFRFPFDVDEEAIESLYKVIGATVLELQAHSLKRGMLVPDTKLWELYGRKLHHRIERPLYAGILTEEEAIQRKMRFATGQAENAFGSLQYYWLVDEMDGVIVSVKFQLFGTSLLLGLADLFSELLMRKNYSQAMRISKGELLKKLEDCRLKWEDVQPYYELILQAVQDTADQCLDIPFLELALPTSSFEMDLCFPEFPSFSKERKLEIIREVIEQEIQPYIALDAGGVKVLDLVNDQEVIIAYEGTCTSCYSATGSTLEAIQQLLKAKVHPSLYVTPDLSALGIDRKTPYSS